MYRLLIVEDDAGLAEAMKERVGEFGHEVRCADDFQNVLKTFLEFQPQLVLMDIMLPFFNGYYWCSEIRKISNVPIIFLSSAADNLNIVTAMQMGGDVFIAKPIDLEVMSAKIGAMLRRTYHLNQQIPVFEYRGAVLNLNDTSLTYNGEKIDLTKNEFKILETLMANRGKVVSRETLMTKLWQMDVYVEENTLTVNVNRLRKKLSHAGLEDFITTKIGSGYILE